MTKSAQIKTLNLALQGGGSHGAFTWGVLDALLEDNRLDFEAISATSAGAMNAAALVQGMSTSGREKARELLESFWKDIADASAFYNPLTQTQNNIAKFWNLDAHPAYAQYQSFAEGLISNVSPYQFNPLNIEPLRAILENIIDIDKVHSCDCTKLFITATNVCTGTPKVFENEEVSIDAILASAALPFLFQAIEIDGQAYWDGGYMGNPSLWPLFYNAQSRDILVVHVNPIIRDEIPKDTSAIQDRLNEITFNAALLKELRAIDFVKRLIGEDMLKDEYKDYYKDILLHAIRAEDTMGGLSASSKFNTDWSFLKDLRDQGRAEAQNWLKTHFKDIGQRSSVDIKTDYLNVG
ncbi:MAG: patatin-like phospholipase family protein [Rhodospirillales bacterium]|nr:patatin-like phospholipase family protein [Alphaproteobacteria bacterium]MCB9981515.1 patatin-like phospholipase family protein [Rhodospirillales bacterium]